MGPEVPFHKSSIGNLMVYQDRIETNLLQLRAHSETSEWFSIIFGIIYEVNIVAEHKQAQLVTIFFHFHTFELPSTPSLPPCRCSSAPVPDCIWTGAGDAYLAGDIYTL